MPSDSAAAGEKHERHRAGPPHKDRWHYLDYRDGKHDRNYIEWKYFNFIQKGVAGYIIYYVLDPERSTQVGGGRLLARVFSDGTSTGLIKKIGMDTIQFDPVSASATFDRASIEEADPHHYRLHARFDDMAWDLRYGQETPTIESFTGVNPGVLSWERANWLIKMPRAHVEGSIRLNDREFRINALGYSDTNWGELMPFFSRYEWGQYNDETVSLVFGAFVGLRGIKNTFLYFSLHGRTVSLDGARMRIVHTQWGRDRVANIKVPVASTFEAEKDGYTLTFRTKLVQSDSPGLRVHPLLPRVVVSEQLVRYEGTIEKDGAVLHRFAGEGFQEWSTRTWRTIAVEF